MTLTTVFTDSFTGTDGDAWSANWSTGGTGSATVVLNTNRGRISTSNTGNEYGYGIANMTDAVDMEIVGVLTKTASDRNYVMTVGLNGTGITAGSNGVFEFTNGVWFETRGTVATSSVSLFAKTGGTQVTSPDVTSFSRLDGAKNFRFKYEGGVVYIRFWSGSEPGTWDATWTPSVTPGAGKAMFGIHNPISGSTLGSTPGAFIDEVTVNASTPNVNITATPATGSGTAPDPIVYRTGIEEFGAYNAGDWTLTGSPTLSSTSGILSFSGATGTSAEFNKFETDANAGQFLILVKPTSAGGSSTNGPTVGDLVFAQSGAAKDKDNLGSSFANYTVNNYYWVRIQITSTTRTIAVWPMGDAEVSPQMSYSVTGTPKKFSVGALGGTFTSQVDYVAMSNSNTPLPERTNTDVTVTVTPATGSGTAPDATVSTSNPVTVSVTPATGSGTAPATVVTVISNITVTVTPAEGSGEAPGGNFSVPGNVTVGPMVGTGFAPDVTVTALLSAIVHPDPMTGSGLSILPLEFQGGINDPYFQRVSTQVDSDDWWFRLDETSGTVVVNEIPELPGGNETDGAYVGSPTFAIGAPESRRYVSLNGAGQYIQFPTNDRLINEWSFEVTFRTSKQDQVITGAFDNIVGSFGTVGTPSFLETSGGKLKWLGQTGLKTVSDGEWHHVVLWVKNDVWRFYIDGKLDIQRFKGSGPTSTPDTFGGPGTYLESSVLKTADIASGMYFQGDVMEIVQRHNYALDPTDVTRNFYAVFGIVPKEAPVATGSGSMPGPKVKGNTKRAILVYSGININSSTGYYDERTFSGETGDFDFGPFLKVTENSDLAGYKFFPVRLTNVDLKDEVTDLQRFIDFTTDLDLSDIDLIVFRDVPDEGVERAALLNINVSENVIVGQNYIEQQWERMILSLRAAVDNGVSLLVTSPRLATDLGIISTAQVHTQDREAVFGALNQGNATGSYDYRSAAINPFGRDSRHSPLVDGASPSEINTLARNYYDNHRINRYRVTDTVTGLTDLPAYIRTDTVNFTPSDNFRIGKFADKFAYRPDGLLIGDEFLIDYLREGVQLRDFRSQDFLDKKARRDSYVLWSVPPEGVKAGKVVTKFATTYWKGTEEVANPYADNATTIVLEPGDPLNGTPVGGKVFVNFTEEPVFTKPDYQKQLVTPGDENSEEAEWDYSGWRWTVQYTSVGTPGQPQGSGTADEANVGTGPSTQLSTVSLYERYPIVNINVETMMTRALTWLGERAVDEGATVIRVAAATGTGEVKAPNSTAGRSVTIGVDPALGAATMAVPQGLDKAVTVTVFPATGSGRMPTLPVIINVSPATGSGVMTAFNAIAAGGEQVVLYLYNTEATLFMKEEN